MSDDILTDEQRAAVQPVMAAAAEWVAAMMLAKRLSAGGVEQEQLRLTVALALAEARREEHYFKFKKRGRGHWCPRCHSLEAECTRLREALGE